MKLRGKVLIEEFTSRCLEGNALGDSPIRDVPVYLPEGYDKSQDYPLIVLLSGFTGSGLSHLNWTAWGETFPQRLERLIRQKKIPPCVAIMPDCFTQLGGSQYINSSAVGDYEDHITGELLPWARATFNAGHLPEQTILAGKSSGGYGAFVLSARHPDLFGWCLMHSGDCYFAYCYLSEFPVALREIRKFGSPEKMISLYNDPSKKIPPEAMNTTAMAACYSPNPESPFGFDYPFDLDTGEIRDEVWARWLAHDPVRMARHEPSITNLKKLSGLYIECGLKDEFHLQWGARVLVKRLRDAGLTVEHREFDGGHFNVQYRYDESLSWVGERMKDLK